MVTIVPFSVALLLLVVGVSSLSCSFTSRRDAFVGLVRSRHQHEYNYFPRIQQEADEDKEGWTTMGRNPNRRSVERIRIRRRRMGTFLNMVSINLSEDGSSSKKKKGGVSSNLGNPNNPNAKLKKKQLQTFARYLEVECWKRAELRELEPVLQAIANAFKQINRLVQRAQTDDLYGTAASGEDDLNIQGEVQQKLDVLCNTLMIRSFCGCSTAIHSVASEEEDTTRCCADVMNDPAFAVGEYMAVFDPLDGSKNIDASLPVGSIFAIYKAPSGVPIERNFDESSNKSAFLQTGRSLVASGYCLFSATTVFVVTLGSGVDGFTLDPDLGQFLHTHKDIRIPPVGPIYSFNEANVKDYDVPVQRYLQALKEGSASSLRVRSNARYIGALVADVHNILINGGIYGYPATSTSPNKQPYPSGKLRLLYESNPMAMILEQAGGAGSTGTGRILDVQPTHIHQRIPTFLGSIENVYELDQFFQFYSSPTEEPPSE